jgi:hypothetical protein
MPNKAIKKPVEVEYVIWDGENINEVAEFMLAGEETFDINKQNKNFVFYPNSFLDAGKWLLYIVTLEGLMIAHRGSSIIKGAKGEFYPCHPSIFNETYDLIQ